MNVKNWLERQWRRELVRMVSEAIARRDYDDPRHDPGDDYEAVERLLALLYPPDGKDEPIKSTPGI